jgi:lipopolysaccharide export system permease protein
MRILQRYILREIAVHFVAVTGVLAVILVSNRLARVLDLASSNQLPRDVVLALIGFSSITELKILIPIGLFLGIMLALGRLYHDSEMAAVQSCGIGVRQLLRPVLALSVTVTMVLAWLSFIVVPDVVGRAQQVRMDALRDARLANIAPQHFGSFAGGDVVYYAESVDANGMLYNVFVQRRSGDKVFVTVANRAEQIGAGELQQKFVLYKGESYEGVPGSGESRISRFAELEYPIKLPAPADWSIRVESKPSLDLLGSDAPKDRSEFQGRIAVPLMALILSILAVPLARLRPRQGRYSRMWMALLAYFVYQIAMGIATVWIEKQSQLGFLGLWWVHALALGCALWLVLRQDPLRIGANKALQGAN